MSNETKWTPGPWHIDKECGGVFSKTCLYVCDIPSEHGNASLIAAAPELYEELADARELVQALINEGYTGYTGQRGRIDAALSKARGEQI